MKNARVYIIIGVLLSLLLSSCEEPVRQIDYIELPISFAIPAGENYNSRLNAPARVPGDPGTFEDFDRPNHAYVFVAFHQNVSGVKDTIVSCVLDTAILSSDWEKRDTVYYYNKTFLMGIPNKDYIVDANVYLAASNVSLALKKNGGASVVKETKSTWPTKESEIHDLTFYVDDELQDGLQHIYSSPYNYKPDGEHYYGRVSYFATKVPYIHMLLYHVASKVDLMWNVPDTARTKLRVTNVKVKNLFKGDAYLFKPTKTEETKFSDGYTPDAIAGDSPGTWWAGRKYFYTMAYQATISEKVVFPLRVEIEVKEMKTEGTPKDTFDITFKKAELDTVFAPWMRGQITISNLPKPRKQVVDIEI